MTPSQRRVLRILKKTGYAVTFVHTKLSKHDKIYVRVGEDLLIFPLAGSPRVGYEIQAKNVIKQIERMITANREKGVAPAKVLPQTVDK